jgi:hypothetical protein
VDLGRCFAIFGLSFGELRQDVIEIKVELQLESLILAQSERWRQA